MNQRQQQILSLLGDEEELSVAWLAETLKTSQVTVRKDIDALALGGYVRRKHGTVTAGTADDIAGRLLIDYDKKLAIATLAAQLVEDGDTVLIESGSTCAILAKLLSEDRKNLTIVTNSLFIAGFVQKNTHVVLCGGDLQNASQALVGPLAALCLKRFYGKYLFCGIDGVDWETGFTLSDYSRADTVRTMAECAKETFVLTTSDKFKTRGSACQLDFTAVKGVFTDNGITAQAKEHCKNRGIAVITAEENRRL